MTDLTSYPARLAGDIAGLLDTLNEHLIQATPQEAAQILAKVLDGEDGVLGRMTGLMITGSHFAKDLSMRDLLPPEVWLALGRAANELHDIGLDIDEHTDTISALATRPSPVSTTVPKPAASATGAGRHR
ncbi:hypothetical protein [Streptomyces niveus]|uniref:Uncharacterized protein n=1 Tax=Streptomyces niveus TaxID=193462 RepID=A0ABZ1ZY83_STRNV|nr:hypothetical protein [Streptomyces niveus]EST31643.1 hypothetical protein M877_06600 [Streptomyces niveus NCIMB 11891]